MFVITVAITFVITFVLTLAITLVIMCAIMVDYGYRGYRDSGFVIVPVIISAMNQLYKQV